MSKKEKIKELNIPDCFDGMPTGKFDDNNKMIYCGDMVEYYIYKEGYTVKSVEDGWGRDVPLCRHDQYYKPATEQTIRGKVVYDYEWTGFVVQFEDCFIGTGRNSENLYCIGKSYDPKNKLTVIKSDPTKTLKK